LRGVAVRKELLNAEGGVWTADQVQEFLRLTRQGVAQRRTRGKLLGVEVGKRGYLYPAWQFTETGVLPGLEEILAILSEGSDLSRMAFFLSGNIALDGKRPLDLLREGKIELVRRAAQLLGEQGAP
jgi:hypothetical protein